MALSADAVEQYTQGRLPADDPETARLLGAALAAAQRYCGWPVLFTEDDVVTLDGPGCSLLVLPTLRLIELTSVVEDGTELDVADLTWSPRGLVRKRPGSYRLGWTAEFGGLVVTMNHGFESAPDFESAVLSAVDRVSAEVGGARSVVGPFQYPTSAVGAAFTAYERSILDSYRLERQP